MLKKGGPDGSLRPGMSMKKLVTNSFIVCPKNVIKIWTFYKKKMKFLMKLLQGNYNLTLPTAKAGGILASTTTALADTIRYLNVLHSVHKLDYSVPVCPTVQFTCSIVLCLLC